MRHVIEEKPLHPTNRYPYRGDVCRLECFDTLDTISKPPPEALVNGTVMQIPRCPTLGTLGYETSQPLSRVQVAALDYDSWRHKQVADPSKVSWVESCYQAKQAATGAQQWTKSAPEKKISQAKAWRRRRYQTIDLSRS